MTATQALGWALIHFVWQGALVAAGLAVLLRFARRASAGTRYLLGVAALAAMLILPVATAVRAWRAPLPGPWVARTAAPTGASSADVAPRDRASTVDRMAREPSSANAAPATPVTDDSPTVATPDPTLRERVEPYLPVCVLLWLAGVLLLSLRLLGAWLSAHRYRTLGTAPAPADCVGVVRRLMHRLGITRAVDVLASTAVRVPAVIGALRPVLLVPASTLTGLTPQQLEVLLAHELAHIRRHDYLINIAQSVVETLLFYHPAVWWVSARVRAEREHCCDDLAVTLCGDRDLYVRALVGLEVLRGAPALAAAATGGSLLQRVQRLLAPAPPHDGSAPRWQAGAIALAAALVFGVHALSGPPLPAAAQVDTDRQEPDTVLVHPDPTQPLARRWTWAADEARRLGYRTYWVGYRVAPNPAIRGVLWVDRDVTVIGSGITMSGRMSGTFEGLQFPGIPLATLVGDAPPNDIVQLLGLSGGAVARVHVASYALNVGLDGQPLFWLGAAADSQSVPLLVRLFGDVRDPELRSDLVNGVGAHATPGVVVPVLTRWLQGNEPAEVREEAAEWLALQAHPAALAALARAARSDRSADVRRQAAEGAAQTPIGGAVDTGIALARTLTDGDARREAVESLGELDDPRSLAALIEIARSDRDPDVAREAVESLGDREAGDGIPGLLDAARGHPSSDVRREAVETLAQALPPDRAVTVLREVALGDRDADVQREAVESLGEVPDGAGVAVLVELLQLHADPDVRREIVETLGESLPPDSALALLRAVADRDRSEDVQREAVETMGELHTAEAVTALRGLARSHPSADVRREAVETLGETVAPAEALEALRVIVRDEADLDVRREAVETLGELPDPRAAALLAELARTHPEEEIRREALDTYAEAASPDSAAALLAHAVEHDPSEPVREDALEALARLDGGVGIPAVIAVARTTGDRALRARALELLAESDDPRAVAVIRRMLEARD